MATGLLSRGSTLAGGFHDATSAAPPDPPGPATFYTAPSLGAGLRGIELDRCYVGDYVAGRRHGFGTYTYPNSFFKYEGQWVNGQKHGLGKLSMRDGAFYEGEFVDGEIMGQGTRRFANGNVYIGTFDMGEMHGFGVMKLANGDTYQGPFVHNAFEGVGVYTCANGDVFEGDFLQHQRTGQGRLACTDGTTYEGGWVEGEMCGQGIATYADGSWYKGAWERSTYHGQGEWYQARSGLTYRGAFADGAPSMAPTALTLTWVGEEDPKKAKARALAAAKGQPPPEPEVPPLPVVLGEPLPMPIAIAAQLQEPLPPPPPDAAPAGPPEGKAGKGGGGGAKPVTPPAPVKVTVVNQPPEPGFAWRTADNEWGRQVNLTLHLEPPRPLPPDRLLRALLVACAMPGGGVRVRLLVSTTTHLEPALPLTRVGGQPVASVQVELEGGAAVVEGLAVGSLDDWDRLVSPSGLGWLVASSPGVGVAAGVCRVALPDPKTKKPHDKDRDKERGPGKAQQ